MRPQRTAIPNTISIVNRYNNPFATAGAIECVGFRQTAVASPTAALLKSSAYAKTANGAGAFAPSSLFFHKIRGKIFRPI